MSQRQQKKLQRNDNETVRKKKQNWSKDDSKLWNSMKKSDSPNKHNLSKKRNRTKFKNHLNESKATKKRQRNDDETVRKKKCSSNSSANDSNLLKGNIFVDLTVAKRKTKHREDKSYATLLSWRNGWYNEIPVKAENAMLSLLFPYGEKERGMMKDQPPSRVSEIRESCLEYGMQLEQALSLRRSYMKFLNPKIKSMTQLGLGHITKIQDSATLFEKAIEKYLKKYDIGYITEHQQRRQINKHNQTPFPPTPDFKLTRTVTLTSIQPKEDNDGFSEERRHINWIEAKMFYGSSIIPRGTKNAVGSILVTAEKYVKNYGPGAFIFSFGCGTQLKAALRALGISVLDAHPLDLRAMKSHQRKWCGNKKGEILP